MGTEKQQKTLEDQLDLLLNLLKKLNKNQDMLHLEFPVKREGNEYNYHIVYDGINFRLYLVRPEKEPVQFDFNGTFGELFYKDDELSEKQEKIFSNMLREIFFNVKQKRFKKVA